MTRDQVIEIRDHLTQVASPAERAPLAQAVEHALKRDAVSEADGVWLAGSEGRPVAHWLRGEVLSTALPQPLAQGTDEYELRVEVRHLNADWSIELVDRLGAVKEPPGEPAPAILTTWLFRVADQGEFRVDAKTILAAPGRPDKGEQFARLLALKLGWKTEDNPESH